MSLKSCYLLNLLLMSSSVCLSTDSDQRFPFLLQIQDGVQGGCPQTVSQHQEEVRNINSEQTCVFEVMQQFAPEEVHSVDYAAFCFISQSLV